MLAAVRGPDETYEQRLVGGPNQPGRLIHLMEGRRGAVMTIHGINASPQNVDALAQPGVEGGREVHTFAYDDRFRRLSDSSADLAQHLGQWMERNPGQPLSLRAHSMGGRVTLGALALLQERGQLDGRPIRLDLVAPPLGGYQAANWARADVTGLVGSLVGGMRPGRDMGTDSGFQQRLESLRLPGNVQTRIFVGQNDSIVDPSMPGFQRIAQNLRARTFLIPGADHDSIVGSVANR